MKILMLVRQYYPWIGGTEQQARKLARALTAKGIEVQISTGWWFRNTPVFEYIDNVPVHRNFTAWELFSIRGLRKFSGYLYMITLALHLWHKRKTYDLIHIHGLNYHSIVGILMSRWLGKKVLMKLACSGTGSDITKMRSNNLVPGTRYMLPAVFRCDCIVALDDNITDELIEFGFPPKKIVHLPNGVSIPDTPLIDKSSASESDSKRIVFVGRLHPQKGPDVLIEALGILARTRPDLIWQVDILGHGNLLPTLKARSEEFGLAGRVMFRGAVSDVNSYLSRADIFVLPSRAEGMSNALLEAMAAGLPCLATNVPGNDTLIENEKNAILVETKNPQAMSEALAHLIEDKALRVRLGQMARDKVVRSYAIDAVAEAYIKLYKALLAEQVQSFQVDNVGAIT